MKVAVIGSRNAENFDMNRIGEYLPEDCTLIISGGAPGVDTAAERYAHEHGIAFHKILPDYDSHGRRAPIVRDTQIVRESQLVLAFWDFRSRGTSFTISECIRLGVPVRVISINN
ncbi:MAG: DUF2493 domain-containing protein [Oscillospiraceae bacterium]|nr:DUF2493 domain-containing protein [Oscillospiraceae bacterium]